MHHAPVVIFPVRKVKLDFQLVHQFSMLYFFKWYFFISNLQTKVFSFRIQRREPTGMILPVQKQVGVKRNWLILDSFDSSTSIKLSWRHLSIRSSELVNMSCSSRNNKRTLWRHYFHLGPRDSRIFRNSDATMKF